MGIAKEYLQIIWVRLSFDEGVVVPVLARRLPFVGEAVQPVRWIIDNLCFSLPS